MMVIDASAAVEFLLNSVRGQAIADRLRNPSTTSHVPHLIDLEIAQVFRRLVEARTIAESRAFSALRWWRDFDVARYPHSLFLPRIWALRDNLSAYDAAYVALAEALDVTLVTADTRLARAPGHSATVEVI